MDSPVQQLVPPVVIISACGLLCLAQFARYSGIIDRLRSLHRERFMGLAKLPSLSGRERDLLAGRCEHIETQAHHVLGLAKLIRNALLLLVLAVICMIISSLMIGLGHIWPTAGHYGSVSAFVAGLLSMLLGMVFVFAELWSSLNSVADEHHHIETISTEA
jgi:uncharacterized protein DUF2721